MDEYVKNFVVDDVDWLDVGDVFVGCFGVLRMVYCESQNVCRNDHTIMTAPLPVCSAKLSMIWPG